MLTRKCAERFVQSFSNNLSDGDEVEHLPKLKAPNAIHLNNARAGNHWRN
ncbi:MAG: hypothetical protein WKF71_10410 [Pyrinomonadaceae bacterium]